MVTIWDKETPIRQLVKFTKEDTVSATKSVKENRAAAIGWHYS